MCVYMYIHEPRWPRVQDLWLGDRYTIHTNLYMYMARGPIHYTYESIYVYVCIHVYRYTNSVWLRDLSACIYSCI